MDKASLCTNPQSSSWRVLPPFYTPEPIAPKWNSNRFDVDDKGDPRCSEVQRAKSCLVTLDRIFSLNCILQALCEVSLAESCEALRRCAPTARLPPAYRPLTLVRSAYGCLLLKICL